MEIKLAYGRSGLFVNFPENTIVVEPTYVKGLPDEEDALLNALKKPIGCAALSDIVEAGHTVAISVCDVTRPMPSSRVLPVLLAQISHVPRNQIKIMIATGTHRPCNKDELVSMLGQSIIDHYQVINHVSTDKNSLVNLGSWGGGNPIYLNREYAESDIKITTGFVEPHFFAGFSGGPKLVAPGLAGLDTVMELHSTQLIGDPKSSWGIIKENPLHSAIREIVSKVGIDFTLDVTLNSNHQITGVYAGNLERAHSEACRSVKNTSMQKQKKAFDIVVTTNSGYPLDLNLYQSVKGMSAAARIVKPNGIIICAAECRDGIPEHGAYGEILQSVGSPGEILDLLCSRGYRRRDQWQAQVQAMVQTKARVFVKSDYLSNEDIRKSLFEPVDDIEKLVNDLSCQMDHPPDICVLPQGPQTIPYLEN
jgi:nickel-dependent lactate racemase